MNIIVNPNGFSFEVSVIDILTEALKGTTNEDELHNRLSSHN